MEGLKKYLEKEGRKDADFKKRLIGSKYLTEDVLAQLNHVINALYIYMEESPTAAQVLDLDN